MVWVTASLYAVNKMWNSKEGEAVRGEVEVQLQ